MFFFGNEGTTQIENFNNLQFDGKNDKKHKKSDSWIYCIPGLGVTNLRKRKTNVLILSLMNTKHRICAVRTRPENYLISIFKIFVLKCRLPIQLLYESTVQETRIWKSFKIEKILFFFLHDYFQIYTIYNIFPWNMVSHKRLKYGWHFVHP